MASLHYNSSSICGPILGPLLKAAQCRLAVNSRAAFFMRGGGGVAGHARPDKSGRCRTTRTGKPVQPSAAGRRAPWVDSRYPRHHRHSLSRSTREHRPLREAARVAPWMNSVQRVKRERWVHESMTFRQKQTELDNSRTCGRGVDSDTPESTRTEHKAQALAGSIGRWVEPEQVQFLPSALPGSPLHGRVAGRSCYEPYAVEKKC